MISDNMLRLFRAAFFLQPSMHNIRKSYTALYTAVGDVDVLKRKKIVTLQTTTDLESLRHVCSADLVILVRHVTAF